MAEYKFDKHMMAGEMIDIAKAYNDGNELVSPFAVMMDGEFFTENGLYDESGLINIWQIRIAAPNPKKSATPIIEFKCVSPVAYNGEGVKTDELNVGEFGGKDGNMDDFYSYFPAYTALYFEDAEGNQYDLYYITSKGDYKFTGKTFTFAEDTESFTITWQDDIPGDKGEIVTGFVVRTTPHTEPDR